MAKPLYSWVGHELTFEPRIWDFLGVIADAFYDGNRSKAVNGVVLFSAINYYNQLAKGEQPSHWLTAPAVKDPEQLEDIMRMIERVRTTGKYEEIEIWWKAQVEEYQRSKDSAP